MCEPAAKIARIMPEGAENGIATTNGAHICEKIPVKNGHAKEQSEKAEEVEIANGVEMRDESVLLVKKLSEDATLPTRGSHHAAGFDLYSASDCTIPAQGRFCVPTQISITVPYGSYGRIAPRSGLAVKNFIDVGAGVIDRDYTGEVKVLLFNFEKEAYHVKKGHRIAQLVIEKIFMPEIQVVDELPKSKRGATGFGASGK